MKQIDPIRWVYKYTQIQPKYTTRHPPDAILIYACYREAEHLSTLR